MAEIAVVIPTINRPHLLAPLVANIHETTGTPHRIYMVMETGDRDSISTVKDLDTVDVIGRYGSWAAASNFGYWASTEPFVIAGSDDLRFHPGWDTAALAYFTDSTHIVGVNQGNGRCDCFAMVRREFIEERSGVFDQPNTIYHPYVSQYPDTELADYAKHRGVWADAQDSLVEHMHWTFGKAQIDANYRKAIDTHDACLAVYQQRKTRWMNAEEQAS